MATGNPYTGLTGLSQTYSIDLPSKIFYDGMKKEYPDLSKYSKQCYTNFMHKNISDIKNICERILRYLENNTLLIDDKTEYDVCVLLNYWIHDALTKILGAQNTSDNITSAFYILDQMWKHPNEYLKRTKYYNKCKPNMDIFKYDDWEKRRKLYEYYVDYKTIFDTAKSYVNICKEYYKKIQDQTSLYAYFEEQCPPKSNNCPDFYDKCKNYNPKLVLHNLPCHHQMEQEKETSLDVPENNAIHHSPGQETGPKPGSNDKELTPYTPQIGTNVGHSVLGVAPVLLTATALYRYTPIGTWIRKIGGSKSNSISNINGGGIDEFFSDSENYISYQPM
ncbi:PIR Superfamily Protein [Plasmodium ovale curtisi]|uniref:PIR Superfamily Protein n=1 Tax=Plasmodium ovale curtisi TaxID=864141 RepID=A0A1A8VS33_PLAOA|nr:PIR Superfamily Protein [Plasmodium ovale curtisi]